MRGRRGGYRTCPVPDCKRVSFGDNGLCGFHYVRWRQGFDSERPLDSAILRSLCETQTRKGFTMTQKHGYHPVHIRGYGVLVAPQHVLTAHHCFDTIRLTSPAARQAVDISHRKAQPLMVSPSHLITISAVYADDLGIIWLPLPMDSDPVTMSSHKTSRNPFVAAWQLPWWSKPQISKGASESPCMFGDSLYGVVIRSMRGIGRCSLIRPWRERIQRIIATQGR